MSSDDGEDAIPQEYNDTHRALLQAFFSRPTLTLAAARPLLASILAAAQPAPHQPPHTPAPAARPTVPEALLTSYIQALNAALSPLDYEIRRAVHQADHARAPVYALVNTTSDPQTQLATGLSADEVAFVKRVVDAMFAGRAGGREVCAVRATEAVALAKVQRVGRDSGVGMGDAVGGGAAAATAGGNASSIAMARAEEVLEEMCAGEWFERSEAGYIGLGVRGLMELNGWLREMYDDPEDGEDGKRIRDCGACKDIVTMGQRCSNYDCPFRLHNICVQPFFQARTERKCPKCKSDWTGQDYVGEKAARGHGARGRGSNAARQSNASGRRSMAVPGDDDESE